MLYHLLVPLSETISALNVFRYLTFRSIGAALTALTLSFIVAPLLMLWRPGLRRRPWAVILPPLLCLPSALLAEISRMAERLLGLAGSNGYLFYRASEVQEFYFYLFMLLYLMVLRRRLQAAEARRP